MSKPEGQPNTVIKPPLRDYLRGHGTIGVPTITDPHKNPPPAITDPYPTRLETGVTPTSILQAYDVYFNGEHIARDCYLADSKLGMIVTAKRNRFGLLNTVRGKVVTHRQFGIVQIVPKGTTP